MRTLSPAIAPYLRSQTQAEILALLLLHPERSYTLTKISDRTGATASVVHREVSRLVEAGVLSDEQIGRSRVIRANQDYRLFEPLRQIILGTLGPAPVITEELEHVRGIDEALLFGSWAARQAGQGGHEPRDIDVLVVGDPDRSELNEAAYRAEKRLGIPVNISRVTPLAWRERTEPFLRTLASRPTLKLDLQEHTR